MKRKLLFAVMTLITGAWALSASAQEDVTNMYLTNPGFEDCTAETSNKTTGSNVDYASTGWTSVSGGVNSCGAVVSYGGAVQINGVSAPATDNAGATGNTLGLSAGWAQTVSYKSATVTLPAGYYVFTVNAYNNNSSAAILASQCGFVPTSGTSTLSTMPSYPYGAWVKDEIAFYLSDATEGYFQLGVKAQNNTSTTNAKVFFDNLSLVKYDSQVDYTSSVNTGNGWLKGDGTGSGAPTGNNVDLRENYGTATVGTKLYQNVSGLKNGVYKVVLYATSHNARGEGGAKLNGTRDDVAFVFATANGDTKKKYITASGVTPGFLVSEPIQAEIADINVTDGTLQLGLGLDVADITGWHTIQIKSLLRTGDLDLSAFETGLAAVVQQANDLNGLIPTAGYNAIQEVVTANNHTYTTAEDYETAISNISTAISTYATDAIKAAYAEYRALKTVTDAYTTVAVTADTEAKKATNLAAYNTTVSTINATVEAVKTDASAITAQTAALKQAGLAFITGLEPADAADAYDVTYMITNPNFDTDTNGWTTTTGAQNKGTATNNPFPNPPMWENWNPSAYKGKMYQTVTGLPEGKYEFSMYAFVSALGDGTNQYVYAGDQKSGITATVPTLYTVTDITVLNGASLEIGFEQTAAVNSWTQIDQATLKYVGPLADLTPYIDAYRAALNAAKTTAATTDKIAPSVLSSLNTTITTYDEGQVNEASQAALEEATAALKAANTLGQKSIASYAIIAAGRVPDNSLEGWTCETFVPGQDVRFQVNTWSHEGDSGNDPSGMVTPFIENWTGKGNLLGAGKVYYRLEGLEPGEVYRVSALVRSYNEASADAPNGPNFYVLDDVADLTEVGTTFTYKGMSGIYGTQTAAATIGADGILELGIVVASNRNYNWVAFKNIKISTYDAALAEAVAAVQALNGKVPAATYTRVAQAAIDACQGENYPTTAGGFESAIESLNATVESLQSMVTAYTGFLELKAMAEYNRDAESDAEDIAKQDFATAITAAQTSADAATTVAEVETANAQLKTDMNTYVNGCNPVNNGKFNLTYMLVNPNLEGLPTGKPCDGWYTEQPDGNSQVMTNDAVTSEDGKKTAFYEYWSRPAKANGLFNLYTTVANLPVGTYNMSCYAFAQDQGNPATNTAGVYFYANDTQGSQVKNTKLTQQSVEFVNAKVQDVKIGLKPTDTNTYNWMGIGYVELYKVPAQTYIVGSGAWDPTTEGAGDVTVNRKINGGENGWNAICFPFSMTQAEVEQYFGKGSVVKLVKKFDSEKEHLSFKTRDGIVANQPCLLKATEASENGLTISGRTIVAVTSDLTYTGTHVTMTGCYAEETDVPDYGLFVQGGKLKYNNNEYRTYVNSTRAYIVLNGWTPSNGIKGLNITGLDDEATGIAVVENGELRILDGQAYDLSGRAVKNPTKGLYIINGQKVFLK